MWKNWKTTAAGILALAASLAPIWAPPSISAKIQASAVVFASSGLLAAADSAKPKDSDKQ